MLSCWKITPFFPSNTNTYMCNKRRRFCCRVENSQNQGLVNSSQQPKEKESKKRVLVVGSGWAGLGAAHHLIKQVIYISILNDFKYFCAKFDGFLCELNLQGFDVTVLEGGVDSGFSTYTPDEVGIQGNMTRFFVTLSACLVACRNQQFPGNTIVFNYFL